SPRYPVAAVNTQLVHDGFAASLTRLRLAAVGIRVEEFVPRAEHPHLGRKGRAASASAQPFHERNEQHEERDERESERHQPHRAQDGPQGAEVCRVAAAGVAAILVDHAEGWVAFGGIAFFWLSRELGELFAFFE